MWHLKYKFLNFDRTQSQEQCFIILKCGRSMVRPLFAVLFAADCFKLRSQTRKLAIRSPRGLSFNSDLCGATSLGL